MNNLRLGGGLARWWARRGEGARCGRAPWRYFLPLFGHLRLQVFGGVPFLSARGGGLGFPSPIILLWGGSNSPGLDTQCVKFSFPILPFVFP